MWLVIHCMWLDEADSVVQTSYTTPTQKFSVYTTQALPSYCISNKPIGGSRITSMYDFTHSSSLFMHCFLPMAKTWLHFALQFISFPCNVLYPHRAWQYLCCMWYAMTRYESRYVVCIIVPKFLFPVFCTEWIYLSTYLIDSWIFFTRWRASLAQGFQRFTRKCAEVLPQSLSW